MAEIFLDLVVTVQEGNPPVLGSAALDLRVEVVPDALYAGSSSVCIGGASAAVWTTVVQVNGLDVSSQLIGEIRVDAEEGAARIAEFTLRPPSGMLFAPSDWIGAAVIIDVADNSVGVPRYAMRLFTGVIDLPALDHASRAISIRATDDLQGRCESVSNATLLALIGGYDSPAVFDAAAQGWSYAQDRLSTVPASLDISPLGALRMTPWEPKASPDILLDASRVRDESISVSLAERSALVNQVSVEFDYRFPRVKAECYPIDFEYVNMTNFAAFLLADGWFLQRAQVDSAISSAGGTIESISYTPLPNEIIAVGSGFFTPSAADAALCMGFSATVSFDYAQTIEERHRITVQAPRSVDIVGPRRETITGALEGEYPDTVAVETGIKLYKDQAVTIPPADISTPVVSETTSTDVTLTTETNRDAANAAMRALIAMAKTRIYGSHRGHRVTATVPLIPAIDLDKTLRIEAGGVSAQGKCVRVAHRMNSDTAEAISEVSIAVCSIAGVGIVHDEDPTEASAGTSAGAAALTGAVNVVYNSGSAQDHKITITFPGVEEAERARAVTTIPATIAAPLIEDELVVLL